MTREEAIRILASSCIPGSKQTEALETLIPELAESEDERIKKIITDSVFYQYGAGVEYKDVLDYLDKLEKQKEQKPVESISQLTVQGKGVYKICPRCKERMVRDDSMVYTSMPPQYRYECPKCGESECDTVMYDNPEMEEQKPVDLSDMMVHKEPYIAPVPTPMVADEPKPAKWSEDDEKTINWAIETLEHENYLILAEKLKSLKPQSHWKPINEHMKALLNAEGLLRKYKHIAIASKLAELYEELKKL